MAWRSLGAGDRSNIQRLESARDSAWPPLSRTTSGEQQIKTTSTNVADVSWLNAFKVREWGGVPGAMGDQIGCT